MKIFLIILRHTKSFFLFLLFYHAVKSQVGKGYIDVNSKGDFPEQIDFWYIRLTL